MRASASSHLRVATSNGNIDVVTIVWKLTIMGQSPPKKWFRIMKADEGSGVRLWCCVVPFKFFVPSFHSPCTMLVPGSLRGTSAMLVKFLRNRPIFATFSVFFQTAFLLCLLDPRILGALMKIEELRSCLSRSATFYNFFMLRDGQRLELPSIHMFTGFSKTEHTRLVILN